MPGKGKILFYGYGNPGRQDDGLGIAFVDRLEEWCKNEGITDVSFDTNYQLNIEDAEILAEASIVVFADASVENIKSFMVTELHGSAESSFTTHSASPGYVLYLCETLFNKKPKSYLVHIRGYEWEFKEALTQKGSENLEKAFSLFTKILKSEDFDRELRNFIKNNNEK